MSEPNRAVVIGGSLAGLLAARVLVDRFDEVVIAERDTFPAGPDFRAGVPQSRHLHVLLVRGEQVMEQLLPGLKDELVSAGAATVRWPKDFLWLTAFGWVTRFEEGVTLISCARELIDWIVRGRVLSSPRVRVLEAHDVTALIPSGDRSGVAGVRLRPRANGASTQELPARLVVDASGRNSRAPGWLEELGYARPRETTINAFLGYASRRYEPPAGFEPDWRALFVSAQGPEITRGGALLPIDGGRWQVTVAGVGRDYPPTDEDGFLAFARSFRSPVIHDAIRHARALGPITAYRSTENQLRHYEALPSWPEQFVVLGDALCAFNPIYGQGMSVAAEAALALQHWLGEDRPARELQQRLRKTLATPWLLATGEDFRYPTTEGGRPGPLTRVIHRYLDRVIAVSTVDPVVQASFTSVAQLLAPPAALFRPEILRRALRGPRRPLLTSPPTTTPTGQPLRASEGG